MKATSHRLLGQGAASLRFQTAQVLKFSPLKNSRRTYLFTRIFIPEALLSLLIGASLFLFLTALEVDGSSPWRWYAGYASAALAVLTKGLVGMVFVGLSAAGYLLLSGEWRRWKKFRLASGLGLSCCSRPPGTSWRAFETEASSGSTSSTSTSCVFWGSGTPWTTTSSPRLLTGACYSCGSSPGVST